MVYICNIFAYNWTVILGAFWPRNLPKYADFRTNLLKIKHLAALKKG